MRSRSIVPAIVFALLGLGSVAAYAGPRTAIVDEKCTTSRGKVIDCSSQKCVNHEGKPIASCPVTTSVVPSPAKPSGT